MTNLLGRDSPTVQQFRNCSAERNTSASSSWTWELSSTHKEDLRMLYAAQNFYAYLTPFIIIVGLIGNVLSVKVFTCRRMRKVSASFYLTALAVSDCLVLLTYVLMDWLPRGMYLWPGSYSYDFLTVPGMCQTVLFVSYVFRFMSAWLIVIFTVERFIGVCKPLHRRAWCTDTFAKRAIIAITLLAIASSSYKPALTGITTNGNSTVCTHKPDYVMVNFVLDGFYACAITVLPFSIITVLNCLILRKLNDTKRQHRHAKLTTDDNSIKLEFTAILLTISTTFILLNLPYFILWCMNFHQQINNSLTISNPTQAERMRGWMYIAKTVFFGNYCVNFFLYSLTGTYFRRQLVIVLCHGASCVDNYYTSPVSTHMSHHNAHQMSTRVCLPSDVQTHIDPDDKVPKATTTLCNITNKDSWKESYN